MAAAKAWLSIVVLGETLGTGARTLASVDPGLVTIVTSITAMITAITVAVINARRERQPPRPTDVDPDELAEAIAEKLAHHDDEGGHGR